MLIVINCYPEKSLIYSFPFDPELRATNFSVKMMFSEAFQYYYYLLPRAVFVSRAEKSGPRQRPPDPYTKKQTVVRPKTIERKKQNKQTHQCGPRPAVLVDMRPLPNG